MQRLRRTLVAAAAACLMLVGASTAAAVQCYWANSACATGSINAWDIKVSGYVWSDDIFSNATYTFTRRQAFWDTNNNYYGPWTNNSMNWTVGAPLMTKYIECHNPNPGSNVANCGWT